MTNTGWAMAKTINISALSMVIDLRSAFYYDGVSYPALSDTQFSYLTNEQYLLRYRARMGKIAADEGISETQLYIDFGIGTIPIIPAEDGPVAGVYCPIPQKPRVASLTEGCTVMQQLVSVAGGGNLEGILFVESLTTPITLDFTHDVLLSYIHETGMALNEASEVTYEAYGQILVLDMPDNVSENPILHIAELDVTYEGETFSLTLKIFKSTS